MKLDWEIRDNDHYSTDGRFKIVVVKASSKWAANAHVTLYDLHDQSLGGNCLWVEDAPRTLDECKAFAENIASKRVKKAEAIEQVAALATRLGINDNDIRRALAHNKFTLVHS